MTREKLAAILADAKGLHAVVASRNRAAVRDAIDDLIWSLEAYMAALDAPAQPATPARWPVRSEMPLTDAAIAEQRWQARHAQPVHRPAKLSGYSKDLRVESAQPVACGASRNRGRPLHGPVACPGPHREGGGRVSPIAEKDWRWFGCAGHLIVASRCLWHMHTRIGDYRISSVGAYFPDGIKSGQTIDDGEDIGAGRKYETFVFRVEGEGDHGEGSVVDWGEIDTEVANTEIKATANHLKMCRRYAAPPPTEQP